MTFKNGSGPIVLGTGDTTICTVPSSTEWGVKLTICNITSAARTFVLKHYKQSTAQTVTLAQDKSVAANTSDSFVWTLTLEAGDQLIGSASSAGSVVIFPAITNADTTGGATPLVPIGAWSSSTTYAINQYVSYTDGNSYVSLQAGNLNHQPDTSSAWWMVLAAKGATGSTGSAGSTGATGPAPNLSVGTVTTGAAGSSVAVTVTGSTPNYTLNFTIPKGDTGAAGTGSGTVSHTGTPTAGHLAIFSGSSGDLIADGGAPAASATTDTTNASNISSGTLNSARLPSSGASAGSYGASGANIPNITVDALGRITAVADRALTAANLSALALAGGTMTGKLSLIASASGGAGLNLGAGAAPSSPTAADLWGTSSGLFYYTGSATLQLATISGSEALTNKTYNGNTWTSGSGTLTIAAGKTLTASNSITISGTDSSTLNVGGGGTLGSNAYTSTAYEPAATLNAINTQTASYTAVLGDAGKLIELNNASANTFTIPPNSSVAFATNTRIDVVQYGAGATTITAGAGVTIRSAGSKLKLSSQYSGCSLYKRGTDEWVAIGDLTT